MNTEKLQLKEYIKIYSFKQSETESFLLTSGKKSKFYFNLKNVSHPVESMILIGRVMYEKIKELNLKPKAVGGLTMGADPLSVAISYTAYLDNNMIDSFSIRKEPKNYGAGQQIDGRLNEGDKVIILDDVITTGKSTIKAIEVAKKHKLNILCAIALVDRCEENGRQNIENCGVPFYSIFDIEDFKS